MNSKIVFLCARYISTLPTVTGSEKNCVFMKSFKWIPLDAASTPVIEKNLALHSSAVRSSIDASRVPPVMQFRLQFGRNKFIACTHLWFIDEEIDFQTTDGSAIENRWLIDGWASERSSDLIENLARLGFFFWHSKISTEHFSRCLFFDNRRILSLVDFIVLTLNERLFREFSFEKIPQSPRQTRSRQLTETNWSFLRELIY